MKTVIEMAREAELYLDGENLQQPLWVLSDKELKRFAELVRADERVKLAGQPAQQEPVAWWIPKAEQFCLPSSDGTRPFAKAWEPLYTTPPQRTWVGLTDEELVKFSCAELGPYDLCLEVEAKLKEKNA